MFIKSLETNTLQLSATNKLELKLNDTGAIKNNSTGLYINKYDRHFEVISDAVNIDNGKIRLKFDTTDSCLLSSTTGLAVRTDNISITKKSHPQYYNNKLTRTTNGRRRRCQEIHCECSRRPPREGLSRWCSFPLSLSSVCDR